jgi:hypothetical protein
MASGLTACVSRPTEADIKEAKHALMNVITATGNTVYWCDVQHNDQEKELPWTLFVHYAPTAGDQALDCMHEQSRLSMGLQHSVHI